MRLERLLDREAAEDSVFGRENVAERRSPSAGSDEE
jgi:hypothetical protein